VKSVCDRKAAKKLGTTVDETALEQQVQQTPLPGEEKKTKNKQNNRTSATSRWIKATKRSRRAKD